MPLDSGPLLGQSAGGGLATGKLPRPLPQRLSSLEVVRSCLQFTWA